MQKVLMFCVLEGQVFARRRVKMGKLSAPDLAAAAAAGGWVRRAGGGLGRTLGRRGVYLAREARATRHRG